ncbi:MAG: hypothetical protein D6680_02805 [Cyanobacteria bacterium J007]|jgi:hypothetical protein|nr:MAG: hypothetical protein D6680_02805 [Cyanobacteria bacterium J007]
MIETSSVFFSLIGGKPALYPWRSLREAHRSASGERHEGETYGRSPLESIRKASYNCPEFSLGAIVEQPILFPRNFTDFFEGICPLFDSNCAIARLNT